MKKKALAAMILLTFIAAVLCFVLLRPGVQTEGLKIFLDGIRKEIVVYCVRECGR